jgi:hypothetical protein
MYDGVKTTDALKVLVVHECAFRVPAHDFSLVVRRRRTNEGDHRIATFS